MQRRKVITAAAAGLATVAAGCSGSNEREDEVYAEQTAGAVDEDSSTIVDEWTIHEGRLHLHFRPVGSLDRSLSIIAGAYAGNVDNGLSIPLTGYGYDSTGGTIAYFEIEPDWGQQFVDDELTETEYLERINETRA